MFDRITKIARHNTGEETEFSIKKDEDPKDHPNLSSANIGNISRVTARVERGDNFKEKNLVLKHYFTYSKEDPGYNRDIAISVYNALKIIGLKHIPITFRAVGRNEIVMTDFNDGGNIALAQNKIKESRDEKVESITNFEQAIEDVHDDLIKAALYGIEIRFDAFFMVIPKQGSNVKMKIVIADLEMIYIKHLQKLTDIMQAEEIYRKSADNLSELFSALPYGGHTFFSKDYCALLKKQARSLLLSFDYSSEIKENMSKELISPIRKNVSREEAQLARELSKISTNVGRKLYADVIKNKAVNMGYDKISLPISIHGSDGCIAYMHYQSENGSSFGVDTLYVGYEDVNHKFNTKEIAQTRWPMHEIDVQMENGLIKLNISMRDNNSIQITHPLDALEDITVASDLSELEKNILNMYKANQDVIQNFTDRQD
ncbi:MAG: hypothetical protein WA055_04115 [Candidatus Moraniibacteriota bacterium]